MGQALILEISDHRGRIRHRHRLDGPAVTLGRGYRNTLVLDDPFVDVEHLKIEATDGGDWMVTDLGSRNGTVEHTRGRRITQELLQAGHELRVGRSVIRVLALDQPLPAALPLGAEPTGFIARATEPRWAAPILVGGFALSGLSQYLGSSSSQGFAELASPGLGALMFAAAWATLWAFTNRIVGHRFRILSHLAWTVAIAVVYSLIVAGLQWVEFFTPSIDWSILQALLALGVFATLLVGHFQLVTDWAPTRQWRVATSVAAIGLAVIAIIGQSEVFKTGEGIGAADRVPLKPVSTKLIPATTTDRFFRSVADLKKDLDKPADDEEATREVAPVDSGPDSTVTAR